MNETPQPQGLPTAQAIIGTLTTELQRSQRENDLLKRELQALLRRLYGPKSEKVDPRQLRLLLEGMGAEVEKVVEDDACEIPRLIKARKGKSKGRQALPKSLPRERRVVDIPEAEKQCSCGKAKVKIGSAVSERLDFVPTSFRVIETETLRYACPKCHEGVSVAKAPARAVEKGLAGEGLLAHVAVSKFADHLPLHRQHRIYERHGVDLSVSTLADLVEQVATATTPIVEEIKRQILGTHYLQTDETSVTVLAEPQGTFKGRLWVYLDPIGRQAVFDATPTRERDGPETFLRDFRGKLQADAYSGYDALFRGGGMEEIGCWAHARRRFVEALSGDTRAATMVALIQRKRTVNDVLPGPWLPVIGARRQRGCWPRVGGLEATAGLPAPTRVA